MEITYNHLNLPLKITFGGEVSKKIEYLYDAAGIKVQKMVTDDAVVAITDYLGGYQYVDGLLQYFPTAEGYVKHTVSDVSHYNYVYNYTDHLGNIRLSYTWDENEQALAILEENNYYPFGLKHSNYNFDQKQYEDSLLGGVKIEDVVPGEAKYNYKYNGKELQDELGLGWYDYQARNYDPAIGRWMNIDPLAEASRRYSPYTYALDNPVYFVDPDGMQATPPTDLFNLSGRKIGTDGVNNGVKMVVTDNREARQISRTSGNVDLSTVISGVTLPSDTALQESLNVLNRTISNGGQREETSLVMNNGAVIQGQTGPMPTVTNGVQTAPSSLPALPAGSTTADVEVSIHSHPTVVTQVGGQVFPQSASVPSTGPGSDGPTFQQYNTNIIVGPLGTITSVTANPNGTLNIPNRTNGVAIYNSDSTPRVELEKRAVERILTPQ